MVAELGPEKLHDAAVHLMKMFIKPGRFTYQRNIVIPRKKSTEVTLPGIMGVAGCLRACHLRLLKDYL